MKRLLILTVMFLFALLGTANQALALDLDPFLDDNTVNVIRVGGDSDSSSSSTGSSGSDNPMDVTIPDSQITIETDSDEVEVQILQQPPTDPETETVAESVQHQVQSGDSLWRIAQELLGDGNRYHEIIEANKDRYPSLETNPDLIRVGWDLKVPVDPQEPAEPVEGEEEAEDAQDVDVDEESGTPAGDLLQIPQMTTVEKLDTMQQAVNRANIALRESGEKVDSIDSERIRWLIERGYLTEEEWAGMNPPAGHYYGIDENGQIQFISRENDQPISRDEAAKLDEQDASDEADEQPAADDEQEPADDSEQPADQDSDEEQADETDDEITFDNQYERMLAEIGIRDFSSNRRAFSSAIKSGTSMLKNRWWSSTSFDKFNDPFSFPHLHIPTLQAQLKSAQDHYEKMVRKNKTSKFLGFIGSTIESSGNKVNKIKEQLEKANAELQKAIAEADAKARELETIVERNTETIKKSQEELSQLDINNAANSSRVQQLRSQISDAQDELDDANDDLTDYRNLKDAFK